ncbi:hypothetical protein BKM77_15230 [Pseudomonas syringae]|uniref:DUF3313 family protein n=1 Tax=Pseudomonas syringae TaxID=317 RepID=UPI000CDA2588|nr:DUF3313 family protein [Pseudomonas syringae]POP83763.1 hypothetical protein CXB38_00255 [Pseudomonas syringae]RXF63937.1 hypothetical protein BKM77_15230 [Pseudomonas syringae]
MKIQFGNMLSAFHAATALARSRATGAIALDDVLWNPLKINKGIDACRVPFIYHKKVSWTDYKYAILTSVTPQEELSGCSISVSAAEHETLQRELYCAFKCSISQKFDIIEFPRPDTIKIRFSLTSVKANIPVLSTMARFEPLSFGFNLYQAYCGADGLMVGSITYWVEVQNASTGELLLAFVGRGFPNPLNIIASVGRLTAARYGIDQAPENLDRLFKKGF